VRAELLAIRQGFLGRPGGGDGLEAGVDAEHGFKAFADDGVVVIDTGGSYRDAQAIHAAIRRITDKPVKWAINTGGQDHRWLGNGYFRQIGVPVIAAVAGKKDMQNRGAQQAAMAKSNLKEQFEGTEAVYPDQVFTDRYTLPVKGVKIELIYSGGGHTAADIFVWLPEKRIAFTGDIVFAQRLLGIPPKQGLAWIRALEYLRDKLQPAVIVPGHGDVTDVATAMRDSYDYLVFLRDSAQRALESGAFDPVEATQELDQSRFSYLHNYSDTPFRSRNALHMAEEVFEAAGAR
jgi:glyoxylase-like metal-dependent hydrolase (beta-lactamase superfamily II)